MIEIARRLGVSRNHLLKQVGLGHLKASRYPFGKSHRKPAYVVHREDLMRWLISVSTPAAKIRQMFPLPGPVTLVAPRSGLMRSMNIPYCHVGSMFEAAIRMQESNPWGIVVTLPELGTRVTCESVKSYAAKIDRPLLIGLVGFEGPLGPHGFDHLLFVESEAGELARGIEFFRSEYAK